MSEISHLEIVMNGGSVLEYDVPSEHVSSIVDVTSLNSQRPELSDDPTSVVRYEAAPDMNADRLDAFMGHAISVHAEL